MNCNRCGKSGAKRSRGYWSAGAFWCEEHQPNLTAEDIFEMQKIDADCNDCRHFQRGEMTKPGGLTCFLGFCKKFAKPAKAWPMQYSGHECFEHRKEAA